LINRTWLIWSRPTIETKTAFRVRRDKAALFQWVCRTTNRPRSPAATPPACTALTWRGGPSLLEEPTSLRIDELGARADEADLVDLAQSVLVTPLIK
jgi:hypothetical protein